MYINSRKKLDKKKIFICLKLCTKEGYGPFPFKNPTK